MTFSRYPRPRAWRGNAVFDASRHFAAGLEGVIRTLSQGRLPGGDVVDLRRRLHQELEQGTGVLLHESEMLASLPESEFRRVFQALCVWLGMPVPINRQGQYLKEVRDHGMRDEINAPQRGHLTNQELAFHSDRADITVLGCWSPAAQGGQFRIRSSADVVEQLEQRRPHWLKLLTEPIPHDLRDEGGAPYAQVPLLTESESTFTLRYIRKFNESVVRHGLTLPDAVRQMLDEIDAVIEQPGHYAELDFRRGSIVMVNNHISLHARTRFENSADYQRCLLRCWLSSEFTRPLPDSFMPLFHHTHAGVLRGGICVATEVSS
ncbi:trimethyllysine dioxygenase [Serratia rubidaea]|uniref:Trimethyllysine dioxygenase n=2 Tax=Serratia rubidaea TaxID=61652 RepID=A0A3S5DFJ3_SERRU|nr:TauD/TfdA family dioxygenase [Serratia rubidaea]MBD8451693.1 TauD/TfdA family dioxygenase [Serratia rubidaea]MBS0972847.1 TauD/TfdA family dioxygenase [Serratia rubidaea]MCR0998556.1 TauD/TfdA family dioxygenase [Serratia rubidaea]MDC6111218.1 TauD/TfdA family dioxygenase [Serratia rubidaea]QPR62381.1 TauD/TfdA family dioxygenase [Serratia rubidaea]